MDQERHIEMAAKGGTDLEMVRSAIVNPRKLEPERSMDVCMQCHLETSSRKLPSTVRRADRGPYSFVAGEDLGDYRLSFDRAPGQNDRFENTGTVYRLRQSQCFLKSEGKLQCITCHNPHDIPRGEAAMEHYNQVCQSCHPRQDNPAEAGDADCVGCHMPKRRTDDEIHVVMTDHFIQRNKPEGDLLAAKVETHETPETTYRGEVHLYYPTELSDTPASALDVAVAQVRDRSNLQAGLPRLAALVEKHRPSNAGYYADLAEAYLAFGDGVKAIQYFDEAVRRSPGSVYLLTKLVNALSEAKQWAKAEEVLRRATDVNSNDSLALGMLGWAMWQQDKSAAARATLEKAIAIDPDLPELHNYLAALLGGMGETAAAERELRAALRILPGIAAWQLNLARLVATREDLREARYHFDQAVRIAPEDAVAHLDYGRVLAAMGRTGEAVRELQIAARLAGSDAETKAATQHLLQRLGR